MAIGAGAVCVAPAWAQPTNARQITVAQIVDMSASQIDVSKDFVVGARAAWKDINAKGGIRGNAVRHLVLEVDGSPASLRGAIDTVKGMPQCIALFGTAGDRAASQTIGIMRRELPDLAHIAPWLQNPESDNTDSTFPIFASRLEQISYALKTLSVMGITGFGAVYGSPAEYATYRESMEQTAVKLKMRLTSFNPSSGLEQLAHSLTADSSRVLIFLGGTPELIQLTQGLSKKAEQRYIVAMSDVNLQTLSQMGVSRYSSVIATQVVPLVNSNLPVVKSYRETLSRLYDEPPTPQSLAGFIAARYTFEMLQSVSGPLTRASTLQALQKRATIELGGFRIALEAKAHSGSYVTQSMISTDGRLVG